MLIVLHHIQGVHPNVVLLPFPKSYHIIRWVQIDIHHFVCECVKNIEELASLVEDEEGARWVIEELHNSNASDGNARCEILKS